MLLSLLEGSDNKETLEKMVSTIVFDDLKNRMLNVFGKFLIKLGEFPMMKLREMGKEDSDAELPLSKLSNETAPKYNFLDEVSLKIINRLIELPKHGLEDVSEAFEIAFILRTI
jgi:hypothetical protein